VTRKARFVRDAAVYLQSSAAPARDIFTQPAALVSSLVVVPVVRGAGAPRAALYLSMEAPNDFTNVQEPLLVGRAWGRAARPSAASGALRLFSAGRPTWRAPALPSPGSSRRLRDPCNTPPPRA
jgi:hypothetical protein